MACNSCSRGLGEDGIKPSTINNPEYDNLHHANHSRLLAVSELLLCERDHLSNPKARCQYDCEPAHLLTARAAMLEAARLKDGDERDKELAIAIEEINVHSDADEARNKVRQIRKEIQYKLQDENPKIVSSHETQTDSGSGKTLLIIGGVLLGAFILYKLIKEN